MDITYNPCSVKGCDRKPESWFVTHEGKDYEFRMCTECQDRINTQGFEIIKEWGTYQAWGYIEIAHIEFYDMSPTQLLLFDGITSAK